MSTKTAIVTIDETSDTGRNVIEAGTYMIEFPAYYDASLVTAEDMDMDDEIVVIGLATAHASGRDNSLPASPRYTDYRCRGKQARVYSW